jgi:hypothetical protein
MAKEREPRYKSQKGRHATGPDLERLVLGGSPSGRRDGARVRTTASGDDVLMPATPLAPEDVLNHAPRPRKKKRRP